MLKQQGEAVGRYKARNLMKEAGLVSKQLNRHRYRLLKEDAVIAPNKLNRAFTIA